MSAIVSRWIAFCFPLFREGCKIKALRNKTNTYIKTPVRGEEPVFVVTGRREDVDAARREIISAAEHFTHIRASRTSGSSRHPGNGSSNGSGQLGHGTPQADGALSSSATPVNVTSRRRTPSPGNGDSRHKGHSYHLPAVAVGAGQVVIGVRVPMSMVGLVVGPKGATVKRIQQDTGTYIVTPGRQKDPVFEVIGSPASVERARRQIEAYLETRIGPSSSSSSSATASPGTSCVTKGVQSLPIAMGADWFDAAAAIDKCPPASPLDSHFASASCRQMYVDPVHLKERFLQQRHHQQQQLDDSRSAPYGGDWLAEGADVLRAFQHDVTTATSLPLQTSSPALNGRNAEHLLSHTAPPLDDRLDTEGLLSWFYDRIRLNVLENSASPTDVNRPYTTQPQQLQSSRRHPLYGSHWPSISGTDCPPATTLTEQFAGNDDNGDVEDYDVARQQDVDPFSSWNFISAAAGLLPHDDESRIRRQTLKNCGGSSSSNDDDDSERSPTGVVSSSLWLTATDFDVVGSTARLLFAASGGPTSSKTTAQSILIGGADRCAGFYAGGGANGSLGVVGGGKWQ
jgi:RNA-binding protein MEX3